MLAAPLIFLFPLPAGECRTTSVKSGGMVALRGHAVNR
jgi:hypothetical protein